MEERPPFIKPLYIDEHIVLRQDDESAALVAERAAEVPVDPRSGVARVNRARWEEAQRYERRSWMEHGRRALSDRNEYHRERFAGYAPLRGRRFGRGIELGSGPYTNLRLILEHCRIDEIHVLDPLIGDYVGHPFCRYRNGRLGGILRQSPGRLPAYIRHPRELVRTSINDWRVGGWLGRPVTTVASMIEDYAPSGPFDLVVMINVLEHCQDAERVLSKIDEILVPGGVLVYHDKMYRAQAVRELLRVLYDAGHPLRVDQSVVDGFLARSFTPLMRAEYRVASEFRGVPLDYSELYAICEKR